MGYGLTRVENPHVLVINTTNQASMKLSKESSKLFAEYQRAQDEGCIPTYLEPKNLDNAFDTIRRISNATNEVYGQIVYQILQQAGIN